MKRNLSNNVLLGVCSGLADKYDIDLTFLRCVFIIAFFVGFGLPAILTYVILALCSEGVK